MGKKKLPLICERGNLPASLDGPACTKGMVKGKPLGLCAIAAAGFSDGHATILRWPGAKYSDPYGRMRAFSSEICVKSQPLAF